MKNPDVRQSENGQGMNVQFELKNIGVKLLLKRVFVFLFLEIYFARNCFIYMKFMIVER